jgi:hypothetical protein
MGPKGKYSNGCNCLVSLSHPLPKDNGRNHPAKNIAKPGIHRLHRTTWTSTRMRSNDLLERAEIDISQRRRKCPCSRCLVQTRDQLHGVSDFINDPAPRVAVQTDQDDFRTLELYKQSSRIGEPLLLVSRILARTNTHHVPCKLFDNGTSHLQSLLDSCNPRSSPNSGRFRRFVTA